MANTFSVPRNFKNKNSIKIDFENVALDRGNSVFYTSSNIDSFLFDEQANGSFILTSDITMLLNQKRLDRASAESILSHFDSLAPQSDALKELRSKLSDNDLLKMIKSRYIQSPSELLAYSEHMLREYNQLGKEAQELIDAQDSVDPTRIMETVEPQKTVEPN